jgi:hypothetical protein
MCNELFRVNMKFLDAILATNSETNDTAILYKKPEFDIDGRVVYTSKDKTHEMSAGDFELIYTKLEYPQEYIEKYIHYFNQTGEFARRTARINDEINRIKNINKHINANVVSHLKFGKHSKEHLIKNAKSLNKDGVSTFLYAIYDFKGLAFESLINKMNSILETDINSINHKNKGKDKFVIFTSREIISTHDNSIDIVNNRDRINYERNQEFYRKICVYFALCKIVQNNNMYIKQLTLFNRMNEKDPFNLNRELFCMNDRIEGKVKSIDSCEKYSEGYFFRDYNVHAVSRKNQETGMYKSLGYMLTKSVDKDGGEWNVYPENNNTMEYNISKENRKTFVKYTEMFKEAGLFSPEDMFESMLQ